MIEQKLQKGNTGTSERAASVWFCQVRTLSGEQIWHLLPVVSEGVVEAVGRRLAGAGPSAGSTWDPMKDTHLPLVSDLALQLLVGWPGSPFWAAP